MRSHRGRIVAAWLAGLLAVATILEVQFFWPAYLRSLADHHARLETEASENRARALRSSAEASTPAESARLKEEAESCEAWIRVYGTIKRMQLEAAKRPWRSFFSRSNWRFDM